ncbi:unnamed protein product [Soboliphyme baturini]|uniref:AAA domain-containing protein n=1 Tax=Soboliphyme baturini TaxID=241478 RepID=A0A183ISH9_9BILA|nr:unnamed protein product [Soboliphyme baturini]
MPLEYSPSSRRLSQESLLTLISSSSISSGVSGRRRRFSKSPSSGASSRSSLTDCSFGVVGARNHFYRRSTRHLSVKTHGTSSNAVSSASTVAGGGSSPQLNVKPMSFEVPCVDADTSLVGREWVFHELLEILVRPTTDNGMKGAVIYGATGTGKTSLLQQLASLSPFYQQDTHVYANFCDSPLQTNVSTDSGFASSSRHNLQCNVGASSSSAAAVSASAAATIPGGSWCHDVARSVVGYHFCQIEDRSSCFLPEFLYSVCAMVAHSPQMSAYREYLTSNKQLLKRFSVTEFLLDAEGTFKALFTEPLNYLRRCSKLPSPPPLPPSSSSASASAVSSSSASSSSCERNFLLLVDALDEAEFHRVDGAGDSISSFLVKRAVELLPNWLKVVVSVKASNLDILKGLPLHKINFDSPVFEERLYVDCRSYIEFRIRASDNIQANAASNVTSSKLFPPLDASCPLSRFVEYLSNSSKASFLYLRLLLNLVDQNYVVIKGSNYNVLPVNLSEVLTLMLNLRFSTERAFLDVMPIFSVMLASLCPLTAKEIYEILNAGRISNFMSWDAFLQRMSSLQDFVVMRQDQRYIFFHPAFREWLVKREETLNAKFQCDSRYL